MSEMIERVAKAIYETEPYGISATKEMPWSDVHESQKEGFRVKARAAIKVMMEPTEEMKNCSDEVHWGYSCGMCGGLTEGWEAMISAALKEEGQ